MFKGYLDIKTFLKYEMNERQKWARTFWNHDAVSGTHSEEMGGRGKVKQSGGRGNLSEIMIQNS